MKILVLNDEKEKVFFHVLDVATKAGGLGMIDAVTLLVNSLQVSPVNPKEDKKEAIEESKANEHEAV